MQRKRFAFVSRQKIKKSKINNLKEPLSVNILEGDSHQLPFADNTFDTVVDTFGLCSFRDPLAVLAEMSRVCKPDGQVLLLEHGKSHYSWLAKYQDRKAEEHAKNWGCWFNKDIQDIVQKSGLKVLQSSIHQFGTAFFFVTSPNKS